MAQWAPGGSPLDLDQGVGTVKSAIMTAQSIGVEMKRRATMLFAMPESLRTEHEELRSDLQQAMRIEGRVGEAARALASLLHLHFGKEDDNVLLALGLLQSVAHGKVKPAMQKVVGMVDRLKTELPEMVVEHGEIQRALERLGQAATDEGRPRIADFAARLRRHARLEEEVLYPAAIVLGEYLKFRLSPAGASPVGEEE
jgi:hypothetical protein